MTRLVATVIGCMKCIWRYRGLSIRLVGLNRIAILAGAGKLLLRVLECKLRWIGAVLAVIQVIKGRITRLKTGLSRRGRIGPVLSVMAWLVATVVCCVK